MPGTEKNRSISSEPPTVSRMDWGIYCTMGTMALRRTCLNMISLELRPLTRASLI